MMKAVTHGKLKKQECVTLLQLLGGRKVKIEVGVTKVTVIIDRKTFIQGMVDNQNSYLTFHNINALLWVQKQSLFSTCAGACSLMLMLLHAPVSAKAFYYFDCHRLGTHKTLLRQDYSLDCKSQAYADFLPTALILFLGFALFFPMVLTTFLVVNRNHLHSPLTKSKIGWLYPGFVRGAEFWEIHEIIRKMFLTGMIVYFPPKTRPVVAILICVVGCCTLNYFRPHKSRLIFWIAQTSFTLTTFKYLITVFGMLQTTLNEQDSMYLAIIFIVFDCFVIVGGTACIVMIFVFLRSSIIKLDKMDKTEKAPLSLRQISRIIKKKTYRTKRVEEIQRNHQQYRNSFVATVVQNQSRASTRLEERLSKRKKQGTTVKQVQVTRRISASRLNKRLSMILRMGGGQGLVTKKMTASSRLEERLSMRKKGSARASKKMTASSRLEERLSMRKKESAKRVQVTKTGREQGQLRVKKIQDLIALRKHVKHMGGAQKSIALPQIVPPSKFAKRRLVHVRSVAL